MNILEKLLAASCAVCCTSCILAAPHSSAFAANAPTSESGGRAAVVASETPDQLHENPGPAQQPSGEIALEDTRMPAAETPSETDPENPEESTPPEQHPEYAVRSITLYGETQYDTAASEALYAFSASEYAIVASGTSYVDSLSAVSLAGALECPILLTSASSLPDSAKNALLSLEAKNVIIIGGEAVVSQNVARELQDITSNEPTRIAGETQFDTQVAIYRYGLEQGFWGDDSPVIVASGSNEGGSFADALSISPLAYSKRIPIFLVDKTGNLPASGARTLAESSQFSSAIIAGGEAVVSKRCEGFLNALTLCNAGSSNVIRLAGETQYDTSAAIAVWTTANGCLDWENAAFATGMVPYDALAGSAVQGTERSVLLLVDEGRTVAADACATSGNAVENIKFLGGPTVLPQDLKDLICAKFSFQDDETL